MIAVVSVQVVDIIRFLPWNGLEAFQADLAVFIAFAALGDRGETKICT